MFTGLVERVGRLGSFRRTAEGGQIALQCEPWPDPLIPGESVAVQGVCLTVVQAGGNGFTCDVLAETLRRTTLGMKQPGAKLNLERALRADGRFGGHMVSGHVDGVGELAEVSSTGRDWELEIRCDRSLNEGIVAKGSIAVDGVSLTVSRVAEEGFRVNIIPFTWQQTSFSSLGRGDRVNLESDLIGKYVLQYLSRRVGGGVKVTMDSLLRAGFGGEGPTE